MPSLRLRKQIPALEDRVYLNTGTSGPVPRSSFEAQVDLLRRFSTEGYSTPSVAEAYVRTISSARRAIASLLNCEPSEIVLTNSTSDAIGIIAQGISWQSGDEIITSDLEHISGLAPWVDVAVRHGARVITMQSENGHLNPDQYQHAITARTKLICVSHISWESGTVLPLKEICALAREAGALTLVDGAQSAGHIPIDVKDIDCDFYTVSGQKWLLGPEGTGALYIHKAAIDHVAPTRIGWPTLASQDLSEGKLHFFPDARRFETGTIHAPAYAGLAESISLLQEIGLSNVFSHATRLSTLARELLSEVKGVTIVSPAGSPSGLLTFLVDKFDADEWVRTLWEEHRVIVRSIPTISALRASFHIFNTEDDVKALVKGITSTLGGT